MSHGDVYLVLIGAYAAIQVLYFLSLSVNGYFYSRSTDWIDLAEGAVSGPDSPPVILLYPVLHEAEETMRTTMLSIAAARKRYAPAEAKVVAIPNADDVVTTAALQRLQREFPFLEILAVPTTSDPSWSPVWAAWDTNDKVYWWHQGKRQAVRDLPPKKTRQLVYALYCYAAHLPGQGWLLSYLDADSAVPEDYFLIAAAGAARFDVVQLTNVAGNLLDTLASSFHSMDHMAWDGGMYPHMTARGRHPFYVLGKGLFYRVRDLVEVGGFNPWLTIEDPEIGMKLWVNGRRLGVSDVPLIEEVPRTFRGGITQRKRWVAGFFQSLALPLSLMGMTGRQRARARLNLIPLLSLAINAVGLPVGVWGIVESVRGAAPIDLPLVALSAVNIAGASMIMLRIYLAAWTRSSLVLSSYTDRLRFMARVNPLFLIGYWILWMVPIVIGVSMFISDRGLAWQRTEKVDANHDLVRTEGVLIGGLGAIGPAVVDLREAPERPLSGRPLARPAGQAVPQE